MDRRDFVRRSATGAAGLAVGSSITLTWLSDVASAQMLADSGQPAATTEVPTESQPWRFGVMADSQWQHNIDGLNPGATAVAMIEAINARFVAHDCKFVVQVGDMVDFEDDIYAGPAPDGTLARTEPIRAGAAQSLYSAGLGFFPLRGNHEPSPAVAKEIVSLYPQTRGEGPNVVSAQNFSSPSGGQDGLSYSFDFGGARFVLLDQFARADGTSEVGYGSSIGNQIAWVDERLGTRPAGTHAFVFGHKPLISQHHSDSLTGSTAARNPAVRNQFISSLQRNGVRYYVCGHDHLHDRSLIKSPDGTSTVEQLICAPLAYRYSTPTRVSRDKAANGKHLRETNLSQELYTFGYYVFTVDGDNVSVEFFSASNGADYGTEYITRSPVNPVFHRRERWGYGLAGRRFVVRQGGSYKSVSDTHGATSMRIKAGTNKSKATDASGRRLAKVVTTSWRSGGEVPAAVSDIVVVRGTAENLLLRNRKLKGHLPKAGRGAKGDSYVLSMSFDRAAAARLAPGVPVLATSNAAGEWFDATSFNYGGKRRLVKGRWKPGYKLGTHGVDWVAGTVWAVVNYDGEFAAVAGAGAPQAAQRVRA